MDYKVIITDQAREQLEQIVYYILFELKSEQAADNVLEDADNTRLQLSRVAGSLKQCEDSRLSALGYRIIHFKRHKYFMLYRIDGDKVYVDGIYHDLQDYENFVLKKR